MSKREPELYLVDILDSIEKIESYIKDRPYEKFISDEMALDAVVRNIEIIGEATKNLSKELKQAHPEVPWQKIAGMRNKMIHEYFGIDAEILWLTVTEDIPMLKKLIKPLLD